jgi:hypothetical protein
VRAPKALLAIALAAGGCVMSATGELPEVEVTQQNLKLPGVPRELRTGDVSVTIPAFFQPNDRLGLPIDKYESVKVNSLSLILKKGGGGDLSFVRTMRVTLTGLQGYLSGQVPTEVARYQRPDTGTAGSTLELGAGSVEVVDAFRDPVTVMIVEATGDLPEDEWAIDVVVRMSALLHY